MQRRAGAAPDARDRARLAGADESRAGLEQAYVGVLPAPIMRRGIDQARQQRWPEHREFLRQGIGDREDGLCRGKWRRGRCLDERKRHRL